MIILNYDFQLGHFKQNSIVRILENGFGIFRFRNYVEQNVNGFYIMMVSARNRSSTEQVLFLLLFELISILALYNANTEKMNVVHTR
jgi:hypothetical protein